MIFLTVGSQKFQFNRLLKKIDNLVEIGIIQEEVIAQIGYSDYIPKNFKYKQFMDRDEFKYNRRGEKRKKGFSNSTIKGIWRAC